MFVCWNPILGYSSVELTRVDLSLVAGFKSELLTHSGWRHCHLKFFEVAWTQKILSCLLSGSHGGALCQSFHPDRKFLPHFVWSRILVPIIRSAAAFRSGWHVRLAVSEEQDAKDWVKSALASFQCHLSSLEWAEAHHQGGQSVFALLGHISKTFICRYLQLFGWRQNQFELKIVHWVGQLSTMGEEENQDDNQKSKPSGSFPIWPISFWSLRFPLFRKGVGWRQRGSEMTR